MSQRAVFRSPLPLSHLAQKLFSVFVQFGHNAQLRTAISDPIMSSVAIAWLLSLVLSAVTDAQIELEDGAPPTQAFSMHTCPEGYALRGVHVGENRFLCRRVRQASEDCFVDYSTERNGMHACPEGTYIRGLHVDHNLLTCCFDRERGFSEFSGTEALDHNSQDHGMHVCGGPNRDAYMTGIHIGRNEFLCRTASVSPSRITRPVRIALDPQRSRSFASLKASVDHATWTRATRNWLARILNLPVLPSRLPTPRYRVIRVRRIEGVQQQLIRYPSPVDGQLTEAYLTFPPGYQPHGRYPAVLVTHGHDIAAKDGIGRDWNNIHHAAALSLAQNGAITLAPDTRSWGAYQIHGMNHGEYTGSRRMGRLPQEYLRDNLARVSLLSHVPGVDKRRIFSAGLSLGAYQALWIAAIDTRIQKAVVDGLFLGLQCLNSPPLHHECQTVPSLSRDFETQPDSLLVTVQQENLLLDTADLAALIAPRPLLVIWGTDDPFYTGQVACRDSARRGTEQVYQELGIADRFHVAEIPGMGHAFEDATAATFLLGISPAVQRDYGNECNGMHCCPPGQAMVGVRLDHNEFLCSPVVIPLENEQCLVDSGTQRQGMHACPPGTYLHGFHEGNDQLTCCSDRTRALASQSEIVDVDTKVQGMHGCSGRPPQLMTGIHVSSNRLLCHRR